MINNKDRYPEVKIENNILSVLFRNIKNNTIKVKTEFILDYNHFQEIIGIEILNLKFQLGSEYKKKIEESMPVIKNDFKLSYDGDTDSFYLKISKDRSLNQKAINGNILLDNNANIIGFTVEMNNL